MVIYSYMKTLKIGLIATILLGAGVAFGVVVAYDYTATTNNSILNNKYFDENNYKVFRFQDGTKTCYILESKIAAGYNNVNTDITCVK